MQESSESNQLSLEPERQRRLRSIRNKLRQAVGTMLIKETLGQTAGKSLRGRSQAGLHAWVDKNTGMIIDYERDTQSFKKFIGSDNVSSVIFLYEAGEMSPDTGEFIDVYETNFAAPISEDAMRLLKEAVKK